MSTNVRKSNRTSAKKIVLVGVFGAISTVLMLLSFNVPFIPTFVKLDFSDLPVLLGGYLLGPLHGSLIALIKVLLNFFYNGSMTFGIGETVNLIGSLSFMLPAVLYYQRRRNFKSAVISLVIGTISATTLCNSDELPNGKNRCRSTCIKPIGNRLRVINGIRITSI